jgi:hypothetical protein
MKTKTLISKAKANNLVKSVKVKAETLVKLIKEHTLEATLIAYALFAPVSTVGAAEAKWNSIIDFLTPWIGRLGGAIALIAGIAFGMAVKNDEAESKAKAVKGVIAGCIVCAVGISAKTFLG